MSEYTCEEAREAPVLIVDGVVPTEVQLRLCTTCDSTILILWVGCRATIAVTILVACVVFRDTICVIACPFVCVECTERLAFHHTLCPTVGRNTGNHRIAL